MEHKKAEAGKSMGALGTVITVTDKSPRELGTE
jgi:hypothetical protein